MLEELITQIGKIPNIIAISEAKLKSKFFMFLPGYTFIQQNSITNAGGVGMFVKDFLNYEVIHTYDLNLDECEEIWVKVKINKGEKVFGTIYRHPGHNITQFQTSLETTLEALSKDKRTCYTVYVVILTSIFAKRCQYPNQMLQ